MAFAGVANIAILRINVRQLETLLGRDKDLKAGKKNCASEEKRIIWSPVSWAFAGTCGAMREDRCAWFEPELLKLRGVRRFSLCL